VILSPNSSPRTSAPVRLIVLHTAEGARDRISLGRYFQGPVDASSHVGIDAGGIEQYVNYDRYAWTLLNGNPISDNAELCAFARWTRAQWMSTSPVDGCANPKGILDNAAKWVAERCKARGIPIRKLTPAQVDQGMSGVIGHADWTYSNVGQGDHTDPGANFPWDYVIARAAGTQEGEEEMSAEAERQVGIVHDFLAVSAKAPNGETLHDAVWKNRALEEQHSAAILAAIAAVAQNSGITPESMRQVVDNAVRAANQAHLEAITTVVRHELGEDNDEQASAIVNELTRRLQTGAAPTNGGVR